MSLKHLPGLFWGGRRCFLRVLAASSQGLWYCKESATVMKQISPSATEAKHAIDDLFSSEQQSVILQFLNSASEEELSAVKLLQGKRSFNVIEYRNKHGPFHELQNLLQVPFFQYKTAVKVCNFIINPLEKEEKKTSSPVSGMKCISPAIKRSRLKISTIISKIPEADFYVLEKIGLPPTHTALFPVTLHLRIMEAVLYALLQKRFGEDGQHNVLSMARNAVGRYFGLMLGDVRISGIDLVKQFLLGSVTQTSRVSFTDNLASRHMHIVSGNTWKREEELCDSLLQAIAFYELLILNTNEIS